MPPTLAKAQRLARLRGKAPVTDTYDVVLDPGPAQELHDARREVGRLELLTRDTLDDDPRLADARERLQAAEQAAEQAVETLHLVGLSRGVYEALQTLCPPTEDQAARKETYDVEAFLPALVSACIVEDPDNAPALTVGDLDGFDASTVLPGRLLSAKETDDLIEPWNQAEVGTLWNKALQVCTTTRGAALPFGSGRTRA